MGPAIRYRLQGLSYELTYVREFSQQCVEMILDNSKKLEEAKRTKTPFAQYTFESYQATGQLNKYRSMEAGLIDEARKLLKLIKAKKLPGAKSLEEAFTYETLCSGTILRAVNDILEKNS